MNQQWCTLTVLGLSRKNIKRFYKKSTHAITGPEKSQDLIVGKLKTQESKCVLLVQVWRPKDTERQWYNFKSQSQQSLERRQIKFQSESKGWKKTKISDQSVKRSSLLITQSLCSIQASTGWGPSTWGRTICFTQSTDAKVNFIQKQLHRHNQNNVWPNGHPVA